MFSDGRWKHISYDEYFNDVRTSYASIPMETFSMKIEQTMKNLETDWTPMTELEMATAVIKLKEHG